MDMLKDLVFKPSYCKGEDDVAEVFYLPAMRNSSRYDRISGYFGSTVYIIAWPALKEFIGNGGHIRIICSPILSDADQEAICSGYSARSDQIIHAAIMRDMAIIFDKPMLDAPTQLLAYLIANGYLDIKIAVVGEESSAQVKRLFHDKVGIFGDACGNTVGFRGSMNETYKGLASDGNIESIDVFPNWCDERDRVRVEEAETQFAQLWSNESTGSKVFEFPDAARALVKERANHANWDELLDEINVEDLLKEKWAASRKTEKRPRPHQIAALEAWEAANKHGILEHATGSGKTFTAICAIHKMLEIGMSVLVLVPSVDLLVQWNDEIRMNLDAEKIAILLCGGGHTDWRKHHALETWTQRNASIPTITISTMDTAVTDSFMSRIAQGVHLFVVADEVHRMGSRNRQLFFNITNGATLGLSATPRRYGDDEGTSALISYFGNIIQPPFTLYDAISAGVLTRYFYYPLTIRLNDIEQEEWDNLSAEIRLIVARIMSAGGDKTNLSANNQLKRKLIARARIIKNADAKVKAACDIISQHYRSGQKWIVYCDNQVQLRQVLTLLLSKKYDAYEYHSEMAGDRAQSLAYFSAFGGILVSIRCLDEGVDIPAATHALILASSQNPREFIQRRGRILRLSPEKYFAYLFDVLVLPNETPASEATYEQSLNIVKSELARAIQFGEMAENPSCIALLKNIAVDYDLSLADACGGGFEDDGEE